MQAAAMRRVDADARGRRSEARIGAALGAVAMQHVGLGLARALRDMALRRDVARADVPAHRHAGEAERKVRGEGANAASARSPPVEASATMPT